ncbi:mechanosensitive ion channel domain-containing protein [Xanthobacter tagetidis]|uniref:Mechanosensitive ion channel protein n=1 Tax=Xanthobacter tagetidis TaxID=60216 RepID=A0A3L7AE50_9HYPH|nr:mechanosensitive ion channel domain-containing protein [Xanthobacter tagetidis]MBB6308474.1 small conductance mechanosensitive channel [Xanthobacter tagetidis]RLP78746.1 mechanosensitive ion channel protein [Xanthobacter tagetidis]
MIPLARLAACLLFCVAAPIATAQTATPPPGPPPATAAPAQPSASDSAAPATLPETLRADIRDLVKTLQDDKAREAFVARLSALIAADRQEAELPLRDDWLAGATSALGAFSGSVLGIVAEAETVPAQLNQLFSSLSDPFVIERIAWAVGVVAAVLFAALAAEWAVKALLAGFRRAVEARGGGSFASRVLLLLVRTVLDTLPIVAFAAAAFGVLAVVETSFLVRLAVVTVVNANVLARVIIVGSRAVLAPDAARLRLLPLDDESAAYGFLWVRRFTHTAVYGYFLLRTAWILGLSFAAYNVLGDLLALVIAGMAVVFILQVRSSVARRLRAWAAPSGGVARLRNQVADFWHLLAIAYVTAAYVVWVTNLEGGFAFLARATILSVLTVTAARLILFALHRVFGMVFRLAPEMQLKYPLLEMRANRYLPALRQAGQALVGALTIVALLEIWGARPFEWLASTSGQSLLARAISILVVVAAGFATWELGAAFAERMTARNPTSTRLKTLLPFMMNGLRVVIITIGGLIVLSELGVNIAPLLAGAGVLGLAIGFGAQTLVKDVITGIFILMEDTLSVGDVVEVGAHAGLVEKITIRTVHLRDFDGNVHSLPFGEVQTIKNMSKHFAYAVVDVAIAYRENIDEALAVMAEVAQDMAENGPLAETIIGPFEVVGVEGLKESSVWLRGRFKTRPLGQWNVRREFYRRIKAAFDARGFQVPYPHQTVYFGEDKKGGAPPLRMVRGEAGTAPSRSRARKAEAAASAATPGPLIEEHPGARERAEDESEALLPAVEK